MVLKYLLMGHHLIPGVSGMSGRLCNLLGKGDLLELPASCTLRLTGTESWLCAAPIDPVVLGLGATVHLPEHCSLPQERHPWGTDGVGGMFNGI